MLGHRPRADPLRSCSRLLADELDRVTRQENLNLLPLLRGRPRNKKAQRGPSRILRSSRDVYEEPRQLSLLRHPEDVVPRHLTHHLRVILPNVRLHARDQLIVGLAAHRLTAFAVDHFRHVPPFPSRGAS
jgi:hypothetical protein